MRHPSPVPATAARASGETDSGTEGQGSIAEPVSATEDPAAAPPADSPAGAMGRRILSTAFVMLGPDGHLSVELRNGRTMVLRDVVMRPREYCGVQVLGDAAGTRFCGSYDDVAAARPGGVPFPGEPDPATLNPAGPARGPSGRE